MRNNQPVTQQERPVPDHAVIISHTDAKGVIIDANQDLVDISGFSRAELIGQPHNLLRHPDMPPEAFRDLWATLKAKRAWTGIVKNRSKNGDHYWVKATVTPTPDGRYMSVRVKCSRDEILAADRLYRLLRENPSIRLEEGHLAPTGLKRLFHKANGIPMARKMWLATAASISVILSCVLLGWLGLSVAERLLPYAPAGGQAELGEIGLLRGLLIFGGVSALTFWPIVAFLMVKNFLNSLSLAVRTAHDISLFDLSKAVPPGGKDEIGSLLAHLAVMRNNLQEAVATLKQNTASLDMAAHDLVDVSQDSAGASATQAESASHMAAAVEQLSVSIDQVGEHARDAEQASKESNGLSQEGARVIGTASNEMGGIAESVNVSARGIEGLVAKTDEITAIVDVITDIADQTNLLALNASIEAARAGEMGRGFAVVADEVHKLAERTASSTQQINAMIAGVQKGAQRAMDDMRDSVEKSASGVGMAREAGASIGKIQGAAMQANDAVAQIKLALDEQGIAAREIARSVEQIAQMTERNSHSSHQVADVAQQVGSLSKALNRLVTLFKV